MQKKCQKNKYNVEHIEYSKKTMDMHEKMEKHSDLFALHLSCHLKEQRRTVIFQTIAQENLTWTQQVSEFKQLQEQHMMEGVKIISIQKKCYINAPFTLC